MLYYILKMTKNKNDKPTYDDGGNVRRQKAHAKALGVRYIIPL